MAVPADSALPGWLQSLPAPVQPYVMLARLDRPVGIWLLWIPCVIGLGFQRLGSGLHVADFGWAILLLIGAIAMRGAGCTWNDIADRDYDARVARTAARPLPSGAVSLKQAYLFLAAQITIGGLVWLSLPGNAKIVALLAIPLVAVYPFTKRVSWWPQAWLGLTINWGVFVGAAIAGGLSYPVYVLYFGLVLWTIAYDTIYALQDREDDALIGVRSTARLFAGRAVLAAFVFHIAAAGLITAAAAINGAGRVGAFAALAFLIHGIWQTYRLNRSGSDEALGVFKSNVWAGSLVALGFALAAMIPDRPPRSIFADHEIVPNAQADVVSLPMGLQLRRTAPVPTAATAPDVWFVTEAERALAESPIETGAGETPAEP